MTWEPGGANSFVLRAIQVKMEGDMVDASGMLDLAPADGVGDTGPPVAETPGREGQGRESGAAEAAGDLPGMGITLDRQSGRVHVSLQGKRLTVGHFAALRQLAPVVESHPALLGGGGWQAAGNVVWQRAGFRTAGSWQGPLLVRGLSVAVEGLAVPVQFATAPLQLRGNGWKISGGVVSVGPLEARVDVSAEEAVAGEAGFAHRPMALQIRMEEADLRALDQVVRLAEPQEGGFLRRTFSLRGQRSPGWVKSRSLVAKVYVRKVLIEDSKYYDVAGDVFWDGAILEARNISLRSRFGTVRAALRGDLGGARPRWWWSVAGRNLPWRGGEVDVESEWTAEGAIQSLPEGARGLSEIVWRPAGGNEGGGGTMTRVTLRWNPGSEEPVICPQCVEFRSGGDVGVGDCEASNGTNVRCPLEDPRTGEKHEISLPISLFGLGAN
jgi:hypothetical protein